MVIQREMNTLLGINRASLDLRCLPITRATSQVPSLSSHPDFGLTTKCWLVGAGLGPSDYLTVGAEAMAADVMKRFALFDQQPCSTMGLVIYYQLHNIDAAEGSEAHQRG